MKLSVFLDSIERDKALGRFISERISQALERHRRLIGGVDIRMRDVNGLKGGVDKECKILVRSLVSSPQVVVASHSEPGQAFRAALKKLIPNLRESLDRATSRGRRGRDFVRSFKEVA